MLLLSLALSRTQDDKGRVRWTLFGVSEQGPARAFWQSFFSAPGVELPEPQASGLAPPPARGRLRRLRGRERRSAPRRLAHPADGAGSALPGVERRAAARLDAPAAARDPTSRSTGVRFLLTFRPFARLPAPVQRAYLDGALHLLPFPGSLVFWGVPQYRKLAAELPFATQIPLLHLIERHEAPSGIRVPQSGWLHEARPGQPGPDAGHGPLRDRFKRTHRWARVLRHQDELELTERADQLAHVLFSTREDDVRLYGKPMARNAQIWSSDYRRVLDGPTATRRGPGSRGRRAESRRPVRLSLPVSRHARRPSRGLLAAPARGLSRSAKRPRHAAARRAARPSHGLRHAEAGSRATDRAVAAPARAPGAAGGRRAGRCARTPPPRTKPRPTPASCSMPPTCSREACCPLRSPARC